MDIVSLLVDNYFKIMKSINVRSISIAIIVIIILIEFIELFVKPEDVELSQKNKPVKNKEEKSSLLRRIVKLDKKEKKQKKKTLLNVYKKDELNNYYVKDNKELDDVKTLNICEELEVLGSKTIEINTVLDGNRLYMEKKEK